MIISNHCLKQLYISHKTECFSYKGECGVHVLRCLKEELAWPHHYTTNLTMIIQVYINICNAWFIARLKHYDDHNKYDAQMDS